MYATETNATSNDLQRPSILLVDDDAGLRAALARVLLRKGYCVFEADNGIDAIGLACQHFPDLAIVDLGLPGMTGFEVLAQLRANLGASIHTAVLSGQTSLQERVKAFDAGADDFIAKPVDIDELLRKLLVARRTQVATRDAIKGKAEAQRLQLFNSEASSLLAHDINNGISIALANLQYLRDTSPYDEDQLDASRASERALKRISVLSNNFVDIARFEDGALSPERTEVDIENLLVFMAEVHEPRGPNEDRLITVKCAAGIVANVDGILLERILHNLVGNALRYTRTGGSVQLELLSVDQDQDLLISVSNDGPVIPESLLPTVFEKYRTGADGQAMRGMGLFFCRMACQAHGGGIAVTSRENHTVFVIRIPNALRPQSQPRSNAATGPMNEKRELCSPDVEAGSPCCRLESEQYVDVLQEFCEGQFPRNCSSCALHFARFSDYVRICTPLEGMQSLGDASVGEIANTNMLSMVNCVCGTTLSLSCRAMQNTETYKSFLSVTRADAKALNWTQARVFEQLRGLLWKAVERDAIH